MRGISGTKCENISGSGFVSKDVISISIYCHDVAQTHNSLYLPAI